MIDAKKLIEGLPIRIHEGRVASVCKMSFSAASVTERLPQLEDSPHYAINVEALGWRVILALMDEVEQKPAWEPGMVVTAKRANSFYRLDKFIEDCGDYQVWDATIYFDGQSYNALNFHKETFTVHRLPHEFKVGDWFSTVTIEGPLKCVETVGNRVLWESNGIRHFQPAYCCRHVPPPKEVMPNETRPDLQMQSVRTTPSAVTGAHRAVETSEIEKWVDESNETEIAEYVEAKGEDPFQGPHWDALDLEIEQLKPMHTLSLRPRYYELLRQRDLRDELRRMRGGK